MIFELFCRLVVAWPGLLHIPAIHRAHNRLFLRALKARRLRYDGPVVLDMPNTPEQWTVIDPDSPHYRRTNCRETLLELGFTDDEMRRARRQK